MHTKQDTSSITCQCRSSHHMRWPSYSSPTYVPQQHHSQLRGSPLQAAFAHAKAAAAAGQECIQELMQRVHRGQGGQTQPVKRPGENVPAGMLKLTLHDLELTTPGLCFCVIKVGPHWGRTSTLTASPKAAWDWEVNTCWSQACKMNDREIQTVGSRLTLAVGHACTASSALAWMPCAQLLDANGRTSQACLQSC